jgi:hypothetical protein
MHIQNSFELLAATACLSLWLYKWNGREEGNELFCENKQEKNCLNCKQTLSNPKRRFIHVFVHSLLSSLDLDTVIIIMKY